MRIILNPNLILWANERLEMAIPSTNIDHFVFFPFKPYYLELLTDFLNFKDYSNIEDVDELETIKSLIGNKVLIPEANYDSELSKSEMWKGLRFVDLLHNGNEQYSIKSKEINLNTVYIIDDLFSILEKQLMSFWFASSQYRLNDIDKEDSQYSRHWVNSILDIDSNVSYFPIFKKINEFINKLHPHLDLQLFEIKAYLATYGDLATYHQDSELIETLTVVTYFHNKWELDWNGELIICDESWEPEIAISPKPGRIVAFNGKLPHRAGTPSKISFDGRKTLVLRYKVLATVNRPAL